ncbi:MAG: hypothetical protein QXW01_00310 [Candidatus Aenigmatarchaeota archaeon]
MSLKTLLNLLFTNKRKAEHIRNSAEELLYKLREGPLSVSEAKEIVKKRKTYFKIVRKLKAVGLISVSKDVDGNYNLYLSLDAYKYFVKKNLIDGVEEVLKKKTIQQNSE